LWGLHGLQVSSQLNADFWRGDSALGLSATQSALLEYVWKPLHRLWPWLPLFVGGVGYACYRWWRAWQRGESAADLVLLLSLLLLNYGIAAIKPDPDVRYLYPSLPLMAIFAGGLSAAWLGQRYRSWLTWGTALLLALGSIFVVTSTLRAAPERAGLAEIRALGARGDMTLENTVVINDDIPPPGPRRNDPLRDSAYFYLGFAPPNVPWSQTASELPANAQYFVARRKRAYEARLRDYGLALVTRSAKLLVFKKP
jgi:4-amino-4-deoxy-L-arabinose transferase-like glycosyltransferase